MMSSSSPAAAAPLSRGGDNLSGYSLTGGANDAAADPYLLDDFRPLELASKKILSALRQDESAPDADLYRRLVSSSGVGAHRYHPAGGEDGCGEVDKNGGGVGGASSGDAVGGGGGRGQASSSSSSSSSSSTGGNVIGSPLGLLRGSRQYGGGSTPGRPSDPANANAGNASNGGVDGRSSSFPGGSGLNKVAAPPTSYLRHDRSLPLPAHLAAEARNARLSSSMGLLPDANLVWLSADNKLFLWSYRAVSGDDRASDDAWSAARSSSRRREDRQDYCSFSVPSGQLVVSVGLVRPRLGVFKESVEWCLVVTTPEEAILCALARESPAEEGNDDDDDGGFCHGSDSVLRLVPTRYVLPTDSTPLLSVCGSRDGRIFLGGSDGCLYEMSYEGNVPPGGGGNGVASGSGAMERAIDDYFDGRGTFSLDNDGAHARRDSWSVLRGGKRVFSALTFGSLDDYPPHGGRSRKCRRINHSSVAPGALSGGVAGAMVRAVASGLFGSGVEAEARKGGPIVSVVLDEERLCLYTLGAKGMICAYDLSPLPTGDGKSTSSPAAAAAASPPRLASAFDAPATAQIYLDSVSRGRMYPPSTAQSASLGIVAFPGGVASAQAGVGGMSGAQDILKRFDSERRILKSTARSSSAKNAGRGWSNTAGMLDPVSIHLVQTTQSKSLTLVAVTGGGLRYYLSSLSSAYINSAQSVRGGGFDYGGGRVGADPRRTRPGRKMMLCHVRAPPPYTSLGGNDGLHFELAPSAVNYFSRDGGGAGGGLPPGIHNVVAGRIGAAAGGGSAGGDVVKGYYGNGVFVLAVDVEKTKLATGGGSSRTNNFFSAPLEGRGSSESEGDAIVVALPDFAARMLPSQSAAASSANGYANNNVAAPALNSKPGGISETIELPMSGLGGTVSPVLPGGRTFDIVVADANGSSRDAVASLFRQSETPSDVELQVGPMPAFTPAQKMPSKKYAPTSSSSRALVVSSDRGRGMISLALSALSFYLRSEQGNGCQVGTVLQGSNDPHTTYRVSFRHGCDSLGFSNSAGEASAQARTRSRNGSSRGVAAAASAKSARLPSWLLRPSAAPLNEEASQHLLSPGSGSSAGSDILILNSGGLHFFANSSLLNNLASMLSRASNVAKDGLVSNFFASYGHVEGCAMCFALASTSSSETLRNKAEKAALCYSQSPGMKLVVPSSGDRLQHHPMTSYAFQPSSLYEGLVRFLSRLLRPFWYKPAVVVTEGRPIRSRSPYANYYASLPAKVELLLDDRTLDELRRPLARLQKLMKKLFDPAVRDVPGAALNKHSNNDEMDVDGWEGGGDSPGGGRITRALQNQSRAAAQLLNGANPHATTAEELRTAACHTENRNMHSLYRLLSRCVQLLDLVSCLVRTHSSPALPEVQWGTLHGLTFCQLATSREGQQRVESLLNALVIQGERTLVSGVSTEGDLLVETLSRECYLFFSSASRFTHLGFRLAKDALSRPLNSTRANQLANEAASYLRAASRHWYDPWLVAGRLLSNSNGGDEQASWEEVASNAMESESLLALAADVLMKLGDVEGMVAVCLTCAANFGGARVLRDERNELGENVHEALNWERGLYHRPPPAGGEGGAADSSFAGTRAIVTGMEVAPVDALRACHSIIFSFVSKLLGEAGEANQLMAERLVAACAASSDVKFLRSLYEHLLATNRVDTALRIESPSLEKWLLEETKDVDLLWKHYDFHGRHVSAGNIMWKEALETEERVPVHRRIECLTRAANSFDLALRGNRPGEIKRRVVGRGIPSDQEESLQEEQITAATLQSQIAQIKEQLDVLCIQQRILTTVSQSQGADLEPAKMDALAYAIVNVSDLFNEYASTLNLFDVCLLILQTCHENDAQAIPTLWKSILCEEVLPCRTSSEFVAQFLEKLKEGSMLAGEMIAFGSAEGEGDALPNFENGEWVPRLRNRVSTLGKELFGKGVNYTFPLDLIVRELEGLREVYESTCKEDHVPQPWPAQTVLDAGVPFDMLLESYDSLMVIENAAIGGVDVATRLKWLSSISELLELWVTVALSTYDNGQGESASSQLIRVIRTGGLQHRISEYKSALEGLVGSNAATLTFVEERFAKVEETLSEEFY